MIRKGRKTPNNKVKTPEENALGKKGGVLQVKKKKIIVKIYFPALKS